jgi:hypothetical protein
MNVSAVNRASHFVEALGRPKKIDGVLELLGNAVVLGA